SVVCTDFFFSSRRQHTSFKCDWSSDVCSSDLEGIFLQRVIDTFHHVEVRFSAPVVGDFVGEFLTVTGRASAVDHQRDIAWRGKRSEERRGGKERRTAGGRDR